MNSFTAASASFNSSGYSTPSPPSTLPSVDSLAATDISVSSGSKKMAINGGLSNKSSLQKGGGGEGKNLRECNEASPSSFSSSVSSTSILNYNLHDYIINCQGTEVCLRSMKVEDYKEVRNLLPKVSRSNTIHSESDVHEMLTLPTYHAFCAYRQDTGALVGFAELYRMPHLGRIFDARLERVVVDENFRGKGLATKMCEIICKEAKEKLKCGRIDLTVEKADARHIYESKLGFREVDTTLMRLIFEHL